MISNHDKNKCAMMAKHAIETVDGSTLASLRSTASSPFVICAVRVLYDFGITVYYYNVQVT